MTRLRVGRGEPWTIVHVQRAYLILFITIPTLTFWRLPRYVLWGARDSDVLIGSYEDSARQAYLRRQARRRQDIVRFNLLIKDGFTPAMRRIGDQFEEIARAMRPLGAMIGDAERRFSGMNDDSA